MMKIDNMKALVLAVSLPLMMTLSSTANAMGMMDGQGMGMMGNYSKRHAYVMREGLAPKYAEMSNPLSSSSGNLKAGKTLYEQNCAACHGATGLGDGPASKSLNPPPADLARMVRMPMASDGYLYWTITEGGAAFGTAMPAMGKTLGDSDIWKLVLYLRSL